jgi:hypothetical protein
LPALQEVASSDDAFSTDIPMIGPAIGISYSAGLLLAVFNGQCGVHENWPLSRKILFNEV